MASGGVSGSGLNVTTSPTMDGRVHMTLTNDAGEEVFSNTYKNVSSAHSSARTWVKNHYKVDDVEMVPFKPRKPRRDRKPVVRPTSMTNLAQIMEAKADDHERQAVELREQAEILETEAKRLRAALDVLNEGI